MLFSEGPGSYTGLRIGAAAATGLCYALDIPLIAINTLAAMAFSIKSFNIQGALCCPMIDARRMEVYCLVTGAAGKILEEAHSQEINEHSFGSWLEQNKVLFFGDGSEKCKSILAGHPHAIFIDGIYPAAKEIGILAYEHFQQQQFMDIAQFSPRYVKPCQTKLNSVK